MEIAASPSKLPTTIHIEPKYWIPVYEVLEAQGIEVMLVNAHNVKHVSRQKSDVLDCQRMQKAMTQMKGRLN